MNVENNITFASANTSLTEKRENISVSRFALSFLLLVGLGYRPTEFVLTNAMLVLLNKN